MGSYFRGRSFFGYQSRSAASSPTTCRLDEPPTYPYSLYQNQPKKKIQAHSSFTHTLKHNTYIHTHRKYPKTYISTILHRQQQHEQKGKRTTPTSVRQTQTQKAKHQTTATLHLSHQRRRLHKRHTQSMQRKLLSLTNRKTISQRQPK